MSQTTVLLVDDDRQLLDGIRRNLCFDYDLIVAESGAQALDSLSNAGQVPVILTDMRMPGMDGVQFIAHARMISPDASYVMLTGNQDLATAVKAVNEGQVFRFLNKPCDIKTLKAAIDAGRRQYDLTQCEKVLLNKTCAGAVGMLMDVLETNQPDVGVRLASLRDTFDQLRVATSMPSRWDLSLASRLALVGLVCFEPAETEAFLATPPNDAAWGEALRRIVRTGGRVISRIPRLDDVGRLVEMIPETDGSFYQPDATEPDDVIAMGATLLHVAALLDAARSHGLGGRQAAGEVRLALSKPRPEYLSLIERLPEPNTAVAPIEVAPEDLKPGMVLHSDLKGRDGYILVRGGKRLTDVVIERVRERVEAGDKIGPLVVIEGPAFAKAV